MLEIAVCDNEKKELEILSNMLHEICMELEQEYRISVYESPEELLNRAQKIDIGILDIVLPNGNGIDLGKQLKKKFSEIELIYVTSYEDYYWQAINKVHAFSFLVKPVDKQELKEQIVECTRGMAGEARKAELVFANVRNSKGEVLKLVRLNVEDILYCEYVKTKREVSIVLAEEVYYYKEVFGKLSEQLEGYGFATNCRGSIVNLRHIRRLKGYTIFLDNGEELQLTQKRVANFKEQMNSYIHNN